MLATRAPTVEPQPLAERLRLHRRRLYLAEARRRGLPTSLDLMRNGAEPLRMVGEARTADGYHIALLHAAGWAEYSRRYGVARRSLSLLCGLDDAGRWAVRVPGTVTGVDAALLWLEPAAVRRAREGGRRVLRQGDVWIVERARDCRMDDPAALPSGHVWDASTRTLSHDDGHAVLHIPFPALAVRQSTLAARGASRRQGD